MTETDKIDPEELQKLITQSYRNLQQSSGKEIILVFGKTGAGKSTMINYLLGALFKKEKKNLVQVNGDPGQRAKIGQGLTSCTLVPNFFKLWEGVYFVDTAGIGDTRGPTEDLFTKIAVQIAIKCSVSIRAVIAVVEEAQIDTLRGVIFSEIAQTIFSICKGDQFYKSFYLFVTKKRTTDDVIESLEDVALKNREAAEESEKLDKIDQARRFREVEAVLSIFLSTNNIFVIDPCNKNERSEIIQRIKSSQPISKACIGKATNSKVDNELKQILNKIASEGFAHFTGIQNGLNDKLQKANEKQLEDKRVAELKKDDESNQNQIVNLNSEIQTCETNITSYQKQVADSKQNQTNINKQKDLLNASIATTQSEIKQIETQNQNTSGSKNTAKGQIIAKQSQITELKNKVYAMNQKTQNENVSVINTQNGNIANNNRQIAEIRNKNIDLNGYDREPEVSSYISTNFNPIHQDYCSKKQSYENKVAELNKAENSLNTAKNDASDVMLYEDSFCESTIYGVVKKGTVHTHKFSYSGKPVKYIKRNGEIDDPFDCHIIFQNFLSALFQTEKPARWSQIKMPRIFDLDSSKNSCSAIYHTPSHSYGSATYKVYGYYRDSSDGQNKIKRLQGEFNAAKQSKQSAENAFKESQRKFQDATKNLLNLRQKAKQQIQQRLNRIQVLQSSNSSSSATISSHQNIKNKNDQQVKNWQAEITKIQNQLIPFTNSQNTLEVKQRDQLAKLKAKKDNVQSYQKQILAKTASISQCQVAQMKLSKDIESAQNKIRDNNKRLEEIKKTLEKNQASKKQSQEQLESIKEKGKSFEQSIKKLWKALHQMEKKGTISLMTSIYELMELKTETVEDFLGKLKQKKSLMDQCKTQGVEIKPEDLVDDLPS